MKKLPLFVVTFFTVQALVFGQTQNYKSLVPSKYVAELEQKGEVRLVHENALDSTRYLMPENEFADIVNNSVLKKDEGNFPFTCEFLYLVDKKAIAKNGDISKMNIQDLSERIRSVSKMQGMTYYSTTRKKRLVLYEKAYTLENENGTTPIKDRNTGNADGLKNWMFFDDTSLGKCRYELNYRQSDKTVYMNYINTDPMKVAFIEPVKKQKQFVQAIFVDCGDHFLAYFVCEVDSMKLPGIKDQIEDSMVSRIEALRDWLVDQYKNN